MRLSRTLLVLAFAGLACLPGTAVADFLGPQQQLTTMVNSYPPNGGSPSLAYNPQSRKVLAAMAVDDPSAPDGGMIQVALLKDDAALAGPLVNVSTTLPTKGALWINSPAVAAGPNGGWLVVWQDAARSRLYGQVIDSNGQPSGPNLNISSGTAYNSIETMSAAWSASESRYLVTWKAVVTSVFPSAAGPQQVVGRFVDSSGAGIGNDFLVTDTAQQINNSQDLAYGNGRWVVVGATQSSTRVVGQVVTAAGLQGSLFDVSAVGATNTPVAPSIAYNEATNQFIVVFRQSSGSVGEYARLLDGSAAPVGGNFYLGGDGSRPRVASAGSRGYLATWHTPAASYGSTGDVMGRLLDADGTPAGTLIQISTASPFVGVRPSVIWSQVHGKYMLGYTGRPSVSGSSNYYARTWLRATPYTLDVSRLGSGSGTVTSSDGQIDCGSVCTATFLDGDLVTLTASSASGSKFAGWGGACSGTAPTCTVTMDAAKSVTASFTADSPTPPSPSNSFSALSAAPGSSVVTVGRVPGAGKIRQSASFRSSSGSWRPVCSDSVSPSKAGRYRLGCKISSAARRAQRQGRVRVRVRVTYTPAGGTARTLTRYLWLRSLKPSYTG
ncbi:MAG: hypothetical protein KGR19_08645 [Acidobacteria bacterium]|nr:hypothetical protein [Acidobacteriota bacterium]